MSHPDDEKTKQRIAFARERYLAATHAMQSGVAYTENKESQTPKHLRVGVNCAMVNHAAIVGLLMKKGFTSEVEYFEALADAMEEEKLKWEGELSNQRGVKVSLA